MPTVKLLPALILLACAHAFAASAAPTPPVDLTQPGPWLVFDISLGWGMGPADYDGRGGVRFEVQASDGGPFERLFRADYARLQWYPCAVNLARFAGKQVRFRFIVEHLDGRIMMDYPHWGNPRIVVGPLIGSEPPREVFNFPMTPMDKAAALLPDGTEVPLAEADPVFQTGLVTPGKLNRDLMLLAYAGDNYICIPGKRQPGIYEGVSMSVDYLRIGADPNRTPWTGKLPPPVFTEWHTTVPVGPASALSTAPSLALAHPAAQPFHVLQTRDDVWKYRPGIVAHADPGRLSLRADLGPGNGPGWAFAGMEVVGVPKPHLALDRRGSMTPRDENSFCGLVVDYHSPRGYQDRTFVGLGAGSPDRYDLRPADWILDGPPLTLARMATLRRSFVDLSASFKPGAALTLDLARYAPADWDGRAWLSAGVQNLPPGAALTAHLVGVTAPSSPSKPSASDLAFLRDGAAEFTISRHNGALVSGRDLASKRTLLAASNDRYTVDTEHDVTRTTELLDRVRRVVETRVDGRPALVVTCDNAALPSVTIEKRYVLLPGRVLSKRVSFTTTDPAGFFLHWDAETALDPTFLAHSSRGGDLAERQVVAAGKVVAKTEKVIAEQVSTGDAPLATATDFSLTLASYRRSVNDRFVLRGASKALPAGWLNTVFVDYLKASRPVSAEMRWVILDGDFTALDRHYQSLPDYRKLWDFRKPEWPYRVVGDAMYLGPPETYPFYRAAMPDLVTTTIWFLNPPWGNWAADSDPPKHLHPDVVGIAPGWRHEFPNARVSAYTNALFDDRSDIYRLHPDFGIRDLEGNLITSGIASDSGGRPTFYFQIDNPACREYLLDMHAGKFKTWGFDFYYMDGPGFSSEVPDWSTRQVAQGYDWLDYMRALRERLQSIKPDAAIFVNGANLPYTDLGYIEWRDEQWQALAGPGWRKLAVDMLRTKLSQEPGFVVVPTYGNVAADPSMAAYDLLYGWCGSLSEVGRLPWMREALNYRDLRLVEDAVEPRWWRTDVNFEALGFRHGTQAVVSVLDHDPAPRTVTIHIDTAKLGLVAGRPITAELALMNDTASELKPDPADPKRQVRVWRNTEAVTRSQLFAARPCPRILDLTLPTRPMLLTTVSLSQPEGGGK
jgi:hypothetical protein